MSEKSVSINANNNQKATIDSYQEFFNHFSIDKDKFYAWGISATIFPDINEVSNAWVDLKTIKLYTSADMDVMLRTHNYI